MRHPKCSHGKGKIGVILQIAAMAMLLCTPHLPLLAHALAVHTQAGRCAMDHRICGCSPERIASRTCCCFRNMKHAGTSVEPGHCHLQARAHEQPDLDDDTPLTSHKLSSLPCVLDPQIISHVTSEIKYLRSNQAPLPMRGSAPHKSPPRGDGYLNPSLEPPDPPPKISFSV